MGRIRDLLRALSTNENVISDEENELVQEELRAFLSENGESVNRISALEKGLETHKRKTKMQEELKTSANSGKVMEKPVKKARKPSDKSEEKEDEREL